ncbi:tol-pal system YbgF family protein [Thermodesulfobacteriota bacterium]
MTKKRVTRKQLLKEPDEFITFSGKLIRFGVENKVQIAVAFGIFFALLFLIAGTRFFSNRAENKAFAMLEKSLVQYVTISKDRGAHEALREVEKNFREIFEKYSRKDGGKVARLAYANICYQGGDPDQAIDLYNKALGDFDDKPSLKNLALSGLAYCYEAKQDYPAAIKFFEMIASGPETILKDEALFNLGRLYVATGNKEKSVEAYKKIISEYSDSIYIELAREKVTG